MRSAGIAWTLALVTRPGFARWWEQPAPCEPSTAEEWLKYFRGEEEMMSSYPRSMCAKTAMEIFKERWSKRSKRYR